jgi:hypothetical protein
VKHALGYAIKRFLVFSLVGWVAVGVLLFLASRARSEVPLCYPHDDLVSMLEGNGLIAAWQFKSSDHPAAIFLSKTGGVAVAVETFPGVSCLVIAGRGFVPAVKGSPVLEPQPEPGKGA